MSAPPSDQDETTKRASTLLQKSQRRRTGCCFLLLTGVVAAAFYIRLVVFSPLPYGAYPVLSPVPWNSAPYCWLANGDLAYLTTNANGLHQIWYQKMDASGPAGTARRGPELPKDILNQAFTPSPDEQWVAYTRSFGSRYRTFVLSANGKTTRQLAENLSDWMPDSRSYFTTEGARFIYHLGIPSRKQGATVSSGPGFTFITVHPSSATLLAAENLDALSIQTNTASAPLVLHSFRADHMEDVHQTWEVPLPPDIKFGMVTASPDNRYLLWRVGKQKTSPWITWLKRLHIAWRGEEANETYYLISDVHGGNLHPVCTNPAGITCRCYPAWTPDSRHLSFLYDSKLYLIPVE